MATKKNVFKTADISYVLERLKQKAAEFPNYNSFLVNIVKFLDVD